MLRSTRCLSLPARFAAALIAATLISMLAPAVESPAVESPSASAAAGAPTLTELRNATYSGFADLPGPVALKDGRWEGAPYAPGAASRPAVTLGGDFRVAGDLNGDGREEGAVILAQRTGGSGTFEYLAIAERTGGRIENLATVLLGDPVQIRSGRIADRKIAVTVVRAGADDAACCPGEVAELAWKLEGTKLVSLSAPEKPRRLALDVLEGDEWVLRAWDRNEPAPAEPTVTLTYEGERFAGRSGCNRYSAPVKAGSMPGDVEVGAAVATRMACPDPAMAIETRYLRLLGAAKKLSFLFSQLVVSYELEGGAAGAMFFEGHPERAAKPRGDE